MRRIFRSDAARKIDQGPFVIRRVRPGLIPGKVVRDPVVGPLSFFDHATLERGTRIPMHEHRNDEILSYMFRGAMNHEDSNGERVQLTPERLMVMNAGKSFYHAESTPDVSAELLQILIRPEETDMEPRVQFYERNKSFKNGEWNLIAGPKESGAPMLIRNQVSVYDAHPSAGASVTVPTIDGLQQWVYVMDGTVTAGDQELSRGDGITDAEAPLPEFTTTSDATLVAFLIDTTAPVSLAGNYSGYHG